MWGAKPKVARWAFVLGNSQYASISKLNNPSNDVAAISVALEDLGFRVRKFVDLDCRNIWVNFEEFLNDAKGCDDVVLYYCGHGVQLDGENFIVPIDFDPNMPLSLGALGRNTGGLVSIDALLSAMPVTAKRLVFLDACRNDGGLRRLRILEAVPESAASTAANARTTEFTRAVTTKFSPGQAKQKLGGHPRTFICFAADPGDVAGDGLPGEKSPFSTAVEQHISTRGLNSFLMAQRVARQVREATGGQQTPWANSNLPETFHFRLPDSQPIYILCAMALVAGFLGALLSFDLFASYWPPRVGGLKLHDSSNEPVRLLIPLLFGSVVAFGAYWWGKRAWQVPVTVLIMYVSIAAFSRSWLANYLPDDAMLNVLRELRFEQFVEHFNAGDWPDAVKRISALFLVAILASGLVGAASVFSAAPFSRDMANLPRICAGTLIGMSGAAMFIIFLLIRAKTDAWLEAHDYAAVKSGRYYWLEPAGIILLFMLWEFLLALNIGRGYANPKHD